MAEQNAMTEQVRDGSVAEQTIDEALATQGFVYWHEQLPFNELTLGRGREYQERAAMIFRQKAMNMLAALQSGAFTALGQQSSYHGDWKAKLVIHHGFRAEAFYWPADREEPTVCRDLPATEIEGHGINAPTFTADGREFSFAG
jgi:hypothetical protein